MGNAKIKPGNALLLPYQRKWVLDNSRLKLAVKSRQIGWTWATGYGLMRRKAMKDARLDAWISSRDDIQARLFLEDCKNFAVLLDAGAQDLGEKVVSTDGSTAYTLQLANGLRIHSMSSNPDAQAGKRGDRVLDEFALHPDPRKLYAIAYPGITWGGKLEIFSTPRGNNNFFQTLIGEIQNGNPKHFSFHQVTLQDALDQGFLYKLQQKLPADDERQEMDEAAYFDFIRAGCADEETFLQEYMCVASADDAAFIDYELLTGRTVPGVGATGKTQRGRWTAEWRSADPIGSGSLYLGVDIGRTDDLTVFWLAEEVAGRLVTRRVKALHDTPFSAQEKELGEYVKLPNFVRACIDATGIGKQFAERARETYGYAAEAVNFSAQVKEKMAFALRGALEDHNMLVPDDQFVTRDFRRIRKTVSTSGNIRFDGERTKEGHSDRFWAAALCKEAKGVASHISPFAIRRNHSPDHRRIF